MSTPVLTLGPEVLRQSGNHSPWEEALISFVREAGAVAGAGVTLTPTAAPAGKEFVRFISSDVTVTGLSFTMPAKNVSIEAEYRDLPEDPTPPKTDDEIDEAVIDDDKGSVAAGAGMLFFDEEGRLSLGSFDNTTVKFDNIALFKFGSVIGVDTTAGDVDATKIKFNPTPLAWGTEILYWGNAPGATNDTKNILPNVPGFVPADYNGGITDISTDIYNTTSNVRAGKGDPCRLIGYTADEIKNMSNTTLSTVLANAKYRMPTREDNYALVGSETQVNWSPDYTNHWIANDLNETNPAVAAFPLNITPGAEGSYNLVAAGYRNGNTGAETNQGAYGFYRTSTATSALYGYYLNFNSTSVYPTGNYTAAYGMTVRCLPVE